jgi:mannitol/fructose-specific phosphotransferase system IIA component (Ntr-type)
MGWLPTLLTAGLIIVCIIWFRWYASDRVDRHGAIYHVFERLGRQRFAGLDTELRGILKEKGLRDDDPYDEVIALARVLNAPPGASFEAMVALASEQLGEEDAEQSTVGIKAGFLEGTRMGATPVTSGVALPHMRLDGVDFPRMVIVHSIEGIMVGGADAFGEPREPERVHAIFFLLSAKDDPAQHLRMLAQIAGRVEADGFMDRWLGARSSKEIKEILFQDGHSCTLDLVRHGRTSELIGLTIAEVELPETCLIVIIRRDGEYVVPRGTTQLEWGDSLTIIGDPEGIASLEAKYGELERSLAQVSRRSGSFPSLGSRSK